MMVVVRVTNMLDNEGISLHWHGLSQINNTWMDGVPFVNQYPVMPHQSLEYRFKAHPAGTHWYHSHFKDQRIDGLFGMIIVHENLPQMPEFHVAISDWFHLNSRVLSVANPFQREYPGSGEFMMAANTAHDPVAWLMLQDGETPPENNATYGSPYGTRYDDHMHQSLLVNGRGRFNGELLPLTDFTVVQGHVYKFRIANAGAHLPVELSIDQHNLVIVATDGAAIKRVEVQTLVIFPGETFDLEVSANQSPSKYWVRILGKLGPRLITGSASVSYVNSSVSDPNDDPISSPRPCTAQDRCVFYNCPEDTYPPATNLSCVTVTESHAVDTDPEDQHWIAQTEGVEEVFLNMGMSYQPHFNGKAFKDPKVPFHVNSSDSLTPCDEAKCEIGCICTHIISLSFEKTIDFVLTSYDVSDQHSLYGHHPVHMHGHHFAVMKQGYPSVNTTTGELIPNPDIVCDSAKCTNPRWRHQKPPDYNLIDPPMKHTVIVPSLGYTVVRIRTNNPGYWLMHCHIDFHSTMGMSVLLEEAVERIPDPPSAITSLTPLGASDCVTDGQKVNNMATGNDCVELKLETGIGLLIGLFLQGLIAPIVVFICLENKRKKSLLHPMHKQNGKNEIM